jgi:hypothetical protein
MNTITMGPTLSNPQAFSTVEELRAELHRANEKLLFAAEQTHQLTVRHNAVLEWCTVIATHHEEGNHDEVKKCLDNVVANKNRMQSMQH